MGGVPALQAGLDITAGKVTVLENIRYQHRTNQSPATNAELSKTIVSSVMFLLQLVMQGTGGQTVQKRATVETGTAAVTL